MTAKLLTVAGRALLSLLLVGVVGALAVLTVVPRAVDGAALTVLTGSMTPEIAVGSVVVVRPVDPGTLQVGDVVTYQKAPGKADYVTHRIVEIHTHTTPVTLTTKGDANRGEDATPVPVTAVRGKVMLSVPYLGTIKNTIGTGGAGLLALVVALVGYALAQVTSAVRERRAPGRTASAPVLPLPEDGGAVGIQLLVATLPVDAFEGLTPSVVARLLRMDLLDEGPESFTVALAREPEELEVLAGLLEPFVPVRLVRSDVVLAPACDDVLPTKEAATPDAEGAHDLAA